MRAITLALTVTMVAAAAGCGGGDKAGGSGGPATLTIGTEGPGDRPAGRAVDEFARQAEQASGGKLRIRTVFRANGLEEVDDPDQRVARKVVAGELDMGVVPARAWDTEGVTSMQALQAPFLVNSDELMERIATDEIAGELLGGLKGKGVLGLSLVPEGLRHPFAFRQPLRSPGDFDGKTIWSPRSDASYALLRALGASPDDLPGTYDARIEAGTVAAGETSFALATELPRTTTATGNVTFYPKINSIVVNQRSWDELTDEQRDALREAARRTVDWARGNNASESEAAHRWCESGRGVVLAEQEEVDALMKAAQPVYASLERDATTRRLISRIRALKQQVNASAGAGVKACEPKSADGGARPSSDAAGLPNGVYRNVSETRDLLAAGYSAGEAAEYNGVHTVKFEDGKLEDVLKSDRPSPTCTGSYTSAGSRIEITFNPPACNGGFTATWKLEGRELSLTDIESPDPEEERIVDVVFGSKPFRKIG